MLLIYTRVDYDFRFKNSVSIVKIIHIDKYYNDFFRLNTVVGTVSMYYINSIHYICILLQEGYPVDEPT